MLKIEGWEIKDREQDYRKITIADFPEARFTDKVKTNYLVAEGGYISGPLRTLFNEISLDHSIRIVNAAVGMGKTTAIMRHIKDVLESTSNSVVIAAPFRSLVEKYENEVQELFGRDSYCSINDIEKFGQDYKSQINELVERRIFIG